MGETFKGMIKFGRVNLRRYPAWPPLTQLGCDPICQAITVLSTWTQKLPLEQ